MKKKKILLLLVVAISFLLLVFFISHRNTYTIQVEKIDDFSPDRKLIVYKNNQKIEYEELTYMDGTYLCSFKNSTVSYSEILETKELIVKISDKKKVVAKIVEK